MILRLVIWENLNAQNKLLSQGIIQVLKERTYQRVSWQVLKSINYIVGALSKFRREEPGDYNSNLFFLSINRVWCVLIWVCWFNPPFKMGLGQFLEMCHFFNIK